MLGGVAIYANTIGVLHSIMSSLDPRKECLS